MKHPPTPRRRKARRGEERPPSPALTAKIKGAFAPMRLEMLQSPAWTALPEASRKVVDRLLVEYLRGRREKNGALVCTYDDFVEAGIRRGTIRFALLCAVELGIIEITRQGFAARMEIRVPSEYRLTFLHDQYGSEPTDEWRDIASPADAQAAIRRARTQQDQANEVRRRSPERGRSVKEAV